MRLATRPTPFLALLLLLAGAGGGCSGGGGGGSGGGAGSGSVTIPIPDLPQDWGRHLYGRWYVTDAGGPGGLAVSHLFHFELFPPLSATIVFVDGFDEGNTSDWSLTVP